jgi:tRNA-dihydrouridine synthase 3
VWIWQPVWLWGLHSQGSCCCGHLLLRQVFDVPQHVLQRNAEFAQRLKGKLILAPLTKGGNLPFRQLCAQFGCDVTMSEMAFGRPLLK